MFVRNTPARTTSSKLLLAAFRTADKFWNSVSGIETNGQAAVLVSREGIPVALTTVDASDQGIDQIVWILRPSNSLGSQSQATIGHRLRDGSRLGVCPIHYDALLRRPTQQVLQIGQIIERSTRPPSATVVGFEMVMHLPISTQYSIYANEAARAPG